MVLLRREAREWRSLKRKSKKYGIPIRRVGIANVMFAGGVTAQLGTGTPTAIMDAKIRLKKKKGF